MKGKTSVIARLNRLLAGELTAADQYFLHSRMYQDWGLPRLYERVEHERIEELQHAEKLIERILFLGGSPDVATREPLKVGASVPEMLRNDLDLELAVVDELKAAIAHCEEAQDFQTRRMLGDLLADTEEDHAYWLEIQLGLVERMGLANYMQSAAGDLAAGQAG